MGLLEELAGAAVAVEGAKKLDPNAGIVAEGIAAVVGFEGTEAVTNLIEKKKKRRTMSRAESFPRHPDLAPETSFAEEAPKGPYFRPRCCRPQFSQIVGPGADRKRCARPILRLLSLPPISNPCSFDLPPTLEPVLRMRKRVVRDIHNQRLDTCGKEGQYPRSHLGNRRGRSGLPLMRLSEISWPTLLPRTRATSLYHCITPAMVCPCWLGRCVR